LEEIMAVQKTALVFARVTPRVRKEFYAKVEADTEHSPAEVLRILLAMYLAGQIKLSPF
jgi:hypothetical protein